MVSGASVRVQVSRCVQVSIFLLHAKAAFQRACQTMLERSTLSRSCVRNECCIPLGDRCANGRVVDIQIIRTSNERIFLKLIWTTFAFQVALQASFGLPCRGAVFVASQTELIIVTSWFVRRVSSPLARAPLTAPMTAYGSTVCTHDFPWTRMHNFLDELPLR